MAEAMAINPAASPAKGRKPSEPVQTDSSSASQQDVSAAPLGAPTTVAEPGSPPLPARHTAATPGPRATRFQEAYASSLAHTLSRIGWDNFATCYPTVAARAPDTLRHVQKQMVERLGVLCEKEFASILESRNVVAKLNELETLVSEAARRKESQRAASAGKKGEQSPSTPPHLLPAETVLAAHLAPHLAAQQSQLNAKLQTSQAHNRKLFEEIQAQRAELTALVVEVERAVADVEGANGLLGEVGEELAGETRAVEVEMGGT